MEEMDRSLPCTVAIDFIKAVVKAHAASRYSESPLVFSDEADPMKIRAARGDRWHNSDASGEPELPSKELLDKFEARGGESAIRQCRSIRNFLTDQHIPYGPGATKRARNSISGPGISGPVFDAEIVRLTLPVVSEDGTEALLSSISESGVHMALGRYYYLRSDDEGAWRVRSTVMSWIS